ncbi:MAG TPA: COX15/CtaA family protein [Methylibium sp.]|uniref:COX15/CtaA family protein n=1 Tax=Methylibium sp. TaxID=2067992 RepID=UPI002DB633F9|nr:COX15/CtaA family protein [Methylibium sp.]HEU4457968.1 COX15/CtaA family protein [Methylibium sp.]
MSGTELVDLKPLLALLGVAVLLAALPLAWTLRRTRGAPAARRLRALTVLTLFLTFDLVLFGAFTRLSDSGLGCPDWPGCYGTASPLHARDDIAMAEAAQPTGPVTHRKAWIEMIHRYLAMAVGALIVAITAWSWWLARHAAANKQRASGASPWWPTFTLAWVLLQGAFGAWTVTLKLYPAIVTLHLLGGLVLLALLAAQAWRDAAPVEVSAGLRALVLGTGALAFGQIALGGWVSTNYAVLACTDFPTCHGVVWPSMDFAQGFELLRPLGARADGGYLSFEALTAIHMAHRLGAAVLLMAIGVLVARLWRHEALRPIARGLVAVLAWQLATGVGNVVLGWPLAAALGHTGGAAVLVLLMTALAVRVRGAASAPVRATGRAPVLGKAEV